MRSSDYKQYATLPCQPLCGSSEEMPWSRNIRALFRAFQNVSKAPLSTSAASLNVCVTVLGANTPAGVIASRALKSSMYIERLRLHDSDAILRATFYDLCDVDTQCHVSAHVGNAESKAALLGSDIVLVAVGQGGGGPVTPAQTLTNNLPLVKEAICMIETYCPCAVIVIASEPVNSMVPFAAEILTLMDNFDPNRVLGSSSDCLRAASVLARVSGLPAHRTSVMVVGGRSSCTAVPVFSQARPWIAFPDGIRDCIMDNMLEEARTVWCDGAALLASLPEGGFVIRGMAAANLVLHVARARFGSNEHCCAFVRSDLLPGHRYMLSNIEIGANGITANLGIPKLSCDELRSLEAALPILQRDVDRGIHAGRNITGGLPTFT